MSKVWLHHGVVPEDGREDAGPPEECASRDQALALLETHRRRYANTGARIWFAELQYPDGRREQLEGELPFTQGGGKRMSMLPARQNLQGKNGLLKNTYIVAPQLWAGEYPGTRLTANGPIRGAKAVSPDERLRLLLTFGMTHFIDLTEEGEYWHDYTKTGNFWVHLLSYQHLLPENTSYVRFPIKDVSTPTLAQTIQILKQVELAMRAGDIVYVHCRGGIGRTGTIIGCYLINQGLTAAQALRELNHLRRSCWQRLSPETNTQVEFIRDWEYVARPPAEQLPLMPTDTADMEHGEGQ